MAVSVRSSQPVWVAVVAVPRSRHSCAWKWLRLASGEATACTAAILPAVQNGCSGASAGCRPKRRVQRQQGAGRHPDVRARAGAGSRRWPGRRRLSPSMPPRMKTTTRVRVFVSGAANAYLRRDELRAERGARPTAPAPAMHAAAGESLAPAVLLLAPGPPRPSRRATRTAASARFGPVPAQLVERVAARVAVAESGYASVHASPQRVVDGVEDQRHQLVDLAAEPGVLDLAWRPWRPGT